MLSAIGILFLRALRLISSHSYELRYDSIEGITAYLCILSLVPSLTSSVGAFGDHLTDVFM